MSKRPRLIPTASKCSSEAGRGVKGYADLSLILSLDFGRSPSFSLAVDSIVLSETFSSPSCVPALAARVTFSTLRRLFSCTGSAYMR